MTYKNDALISLEEIENALFIKKYPRIFIYDCPFNFEESKMSEIETSNIMKKDERLTNSNDDNKICMYLNIQVHKDIKFSYLAHSIDELFCKSKRQSPSGKVLQTEIVFPMITYVFMRETKKR